jgi:hypothetical protein
LSIVRTADGLVAAYKDRVRAGARAPVAGTVDTRDIATAPASFAFSEPTSGRMRRETGLLVDLAVNEDAPSPFIHG